MALFLKLDAKLLFCSKPPGICLYLLPAEFF